MAKVVPFPKEQSNLLYAFRRYRGNPLRRFADMRVRYPLVAGFRLFGQKVVVVQDVEAIEDILVRKHALFGKGSFTDQLSVVLGQGLLTSNGEHHKSQRKLIAPSLAANDVAGYALPMFERAQLFVQRFRDGEVVDIHSEMMHLTLDVLAHTLFGQEFEEVELVDREMAVVMRAFRPWSGLFRLATPEWLPLPSRFRLRRARERLHGVVDRLIAKKRLAPGGTDLLSRLISVNEGGSRLTNDDLRDQVLTLLLAGHETTALSLTFTLYLLSQNPGARERVEAELDGALGSGSPDASTFSSLHYTHAVFQESLRLFPPAWTVTREALEDCDVGGWQLHKGNQLLIPFYTIHRDAAWFDNPDAFRPERFLPGGAFREQRPPRFAYAPFGGGPRVCVGNHFAMQEAMTILTALLRRVRLDLLPGALFDVAPSVTLRPLHPVPMRVKLRSSKLPRVAALGRVAEQSLIRT
jgi:cytochrome P450